MNYNFNNQIIDNNHFYVKDNEHIFTPILPRGEYTLEELEDYFYDVYHNPDHKTRVLLAKIDKKLGYKGTRIPDTKKILVEPPPNNAVLDFARICNIKLSTIYITKHMMFFYLYHTNEAFRSLTLKNQFEVFKNIFVNEAICFRKFVLIRDSLCAANIFFYNPLCFTPYKTLPDTIIRNQLADDDPELQKYRELNAALKKQKFDYLSRLRIIQSKLGYTIRYRRQVLDNGFLQPYLDILSNEIEQYFTFTGLLNNAPQL